MESEIVAREAVREAGRRRAEAQEAARDAGAELADAIRAAHAAGVSVAAIARDAGLSRQGVYDMLGPAAERRS